jgi:hypothetical protein
MFWNRFVLYFQVKNGSVNAREVSSGSYISRKCEGLVHPRMLMGNFSDVESCFSEIVKELAPRKFLAAPPMLIIHLQDTIVGGCSELEARAFKEAGFSTGAREVIIKYGENPISDQNILEKNYGNVEAI